MSWTTVAELYAYLRQDAPTAGSAEETQAQQAIDAAIGTIEEYTGQPLEQSTDTVTLDGPGTTTLVLPRWPVTEITSITLVEDAEVLTEGFDEDYTWSENGIVKRRCGSWPCDQQSITVVYTAGYTTVPIALKRIVWRMAATEDANPTGYESERIGDWQAKYLAGAVGGLTDDELSIVSRYEANR